MEFVAGLCEIMQDEALTSITLINPNCRFADHAQ